MKTVPILSLALIACAARPDTIHHPSAAAYEESAAREDREAEKDRAQYDPSAREYIEHCPNRVDAAVCWTADYNPTEDHRKDADEHRKNAAKFRALSQVMRDVEAKECAGLSDHDRDTSPFDHVDDIVNIAPLDAPAGKTFRREGVSFTFRMVPGMTLTSMQKIVRCHIARNDAMGHDVPYMGYCPLVPPNVDAEVKQTKLGIEVDVSSGLASTVAEIQRRAGILQGMRKK